MSKDKNIFAVSKVSNSFSKVPLLFIAFGLLMGSFGCGEDGPHLYFVEGPTVTRDASDHVVITGKLWSVIQWPAGDSFCVTTTWGDPLPPGAASQLGQVCASEAVPEAVGADEGFKVTTQSPAPVPHPEAGEDPWQLTVTLESDFNENKDDAWMEILTVD